MKHPKLLTIAAATVVVGTSAFAASGTANAADAPGAFSTEYVNTAAQLTVNDGVVPVGSGWNYYPVDTNVPAFGTSGVTTPAPTADKPFSALLLTHATTAPIESLTDIVTQGTIVSTGTAFPLFIVSDGTETETVYPADIFSSDDAQSAFSADAQWQVSSDDQSGTLTAQGTIAEVQAAIEAHSDAYSIVGYGVEAVDLTTLPEAQAQPSAGTDRLLAAAAAAPAAADSAPATVTTLSVDNATTHFTPTPTLTLGATSTTVTGFTTTGVTVAATGFLPGETVTSGYATDASGDALPATFTADANGAVSGTVVGPADAQAGTYAITLIGSTSGVAVASAITVVADPATPIAPVATPVRAAATFAG